MWGTISKFFFVYLLEMESSFDLKIKGSTDKLKDWKWYQYQKKFTSSGGIIYNLSGTVLQNSI